MKLKTRREIDFKRFFSLYLSRFLIALILTIALLITIVLLNLTGDYLVSSLNASFIDFVLMLAAAFFSVATRKGFFDIFAYSAIRFGAHLRPNKKDDEAFYGVYDYTKTKEIKRLDSKYFYIIYLIPILKKISYQIVKLSNKMLEKQHLKAAEFLFAINNLLVIPIFKFISLFKINKNDISHTYTAQWYTSFKKDEIFPLGTIQFEGHTIPAPRNTAYYLETLFGANYMDLPSIEKRDAHKANILFYK